MVSNVIHGLSIFFIKKENWPMGKIWHFPNVSWLTILIFTIGAY